MNFLEALENETNYGYTENGAVKHITTKNDILDMFALCGSYRNRSDADCIHMFKKAFAQDESLALKCLFYIADCRGGQGERRFFRVCFHWLCNEHPEAARRNLKLIPTYRRWDDVLYACDNTPVMKDALDFIKEQLILDMDCKTPSLLAKWLPSENASAAETKRMGNIVREHLGMTHKQYRKTLTYLRQLINIVETLMSHNMWDKIEFDKIPSKAGLIYKNAFARRDIIAKKYEEFAKDKTTKVNAAVLNPVDIAHKAFSANHYGLEDPQRIMLQKYWDNLPNYYGDKTENAIAVVDVSGSMWGTPLEAAVSLGAYIAERNKGMFYNKFITFSGNPSLVNFTGVDIVDKLNRCKNAEWGYNTNVQKVFDLLLNTAIKNKIAPEDMPERVYIFSDMEFDAGCGFGGYWHRGGDLSGTDKDTLFENMARKWRSYGYEMPPLIFWNLDARTENIPALGGRYSYISGFSPVMIETVLSGKTGWDLCLEKLMSDRYKDVH